MARTGTLSRRTFIKTGIKTGVAFAAAGALGAPAWAGGEREELILVNLADTHSPYDAYPRVFSLVERVVREARGAPVYVLFNGDLFELGNVVARRSQGALDWAFLQALASLAPVVMNIGNHEFDFMSPRAFVDAAAKSGVTVVGNVLDRASGARLTPAVTTLRESGVVVDILGVATDQLATYEASSRPLIRLPQPVPWVETTHEPLTLLGDWTVLLTHAGVVADREMVAELAPGTLVVGGHDHLVLRERVSGVSYMHNGFRAERVNVTRVRFGTEVQLSFEDYATADFPPEPGLAALADELQRAHLEAEDRAIVGVVDRDYSVLEAARWAVETLRRETSADVAMLNHTSFGAGLAAGPLPQYRFDEFLRFDNEVMRAEVDGATLAGILRIANQGPDTPLSARTGDFVYASDFVPEASRRYTLVTSSWVALPMNAPRYLGRADLAFEAVPGVSTKGLLAAALER